MSLTRYPNLHTRSRKIHGMVRYLAQSGTVTVELAAPEVVPAVIRLLQRHAYRKPFWVRGDTWVRSMVISDPKVFGLLFQHIQIKMVLDGNTWRWTSWGMLIEPIEGVKPEIAQFVMMNLRPCYLTINPGLNYSAFIGLLDNLPSA